MEPRRNRPKFFNPFTEATKHLPYRPWFKGLFRAMPMHRWTLTHVEQVLEYAANRPTVFGLPLAPTCIVNTAHFLPSSRSRLAGVWVFGVERGCKSLVIPRSCNAENFDRVDARMIENIFRWNPGLEYVYLSKSCQTMMPQLVPLLGRLRNLKTVTLEGWDDAVAIHKVLMACKGVEILDTYTFDESPPKWTNELSVQAINTVVEMHPKLRGIEGSRNFLEQWYTASKYSRCKHNIALIPATCSASMCFSLVFVVVAAAASVVAYRLYTWGLSCIPFVHESIAVLLGFILGIATFGLILVDDFVNRHHRGRHWMQLAKYIILIRRRWYLARRGPSQLAVSQQSKR